METTTVEQEKKAARDEAYKDVKMYIANDWNLKEETPGYFLLTRNTGSTMGHLVVAFFTLWWTLGVGNLIYYFAKKEKKKILK